jgi:hypothetical protein
MWERRKMDSEENNLLILEAERLTTEGLDKARALPAAVTLLFVFVGKRCGHGPSRLFSLVLPNLLKWPRYSAQAWEKYGEREKLKKARAKLLEENPVLTDTKLGVGQEALGVDGAGGASLLVSCSVCVTGGLVRGRVLWEAVGC